MTNQKKSLPALDMLTSYNFCQWIYSPLHFGLESQLLTYSSADEIQTLQIVRIGM